MPVSVSYATTNFLHGTVYRVNGTNLQFAGNNFFFAADHTETRFWASNGAEYRLAVNFEKNEQGYFSFRFFEPIVAHGTVSGPGQFLAYVETSIGGTRQFLYGGRRDFEIWTKVPAVPANFPYSISVTGPWYRPTGGLVYSNAQAPNYVLTYRGPPNNDFVNRVVLTNSEGSVRGSLLAADSEAGEDAQTTSIWYEFTAPEDGTLVISNGIRFTSDVSVWEGPDIAHLALRPNRSLGQTATTANSEWSVPAGQPVYIRVGGDAYLPNTASFYYQFVPGNPLYVSNSAPAYNVVFTTPESPTGRYPHGAGVTLSASPAAGYRRRAVGRCLGIPNDGQDEDGPGAVCGRK